MLHRKFVMLHTPDLWHLMRVCYVLCISSWIVVLWKGWVLNNVGTGHELRILGAWWARLWYHVDTILIMCLHTQMFRIRYP